MKKYKIISTPEMANGGPTWGIPGNEYAHEFDDQGRMTFRPDTKPASIVQTQQYRRMMVPDPVTGVGRIQQVPVSEQEWQSYASGAPTNNAPVYNYPQQISAPQQISYTPPIARTSKNNSNMYLEGTTDYGLDAIRQNMDYKGCYGGGCYEYGGQTPPDANGRRGLDRSWPGSFNYIKGLPDDYELKNTIPEAEPGMGDIVIEKDEIVLQPTQGGMQAQRANAGSHDSGNDKEVNVQEGSFVLSDTKDLKIRDGVIQREFNMPYKKSGYTPAKMGSKYVNDLNKFTSKINNPHTDPKTRETAQMMVANIGKKLGKLAEYQETMKKMMGIAQPGQQMADGGPTGSDYIPFSRPAARAQGYPEDAPGTTADYQKWANMRGAGLQVDDKWGYRTSEWVNPDYSIPKLETAPMVPLPTNIQANNTPQTVDVNSTIGNMQSYTPDPDRNIQTTKEYKAGYTTPDKLSMLNSLVNYAGIKKYLPWEPPVTGVIPKAVYMDPTRALAANSEQANMAYRGAGNRRSNNLSNFLAIQGQAGKQAADILGQYSNANVQIGNQANQQAAQITNALLEAQRNRQKALYQGNTIAAQQYDNAEREARADLVNVYQNAWKNRQGYDDMNKLTKYYYRDTNTGKMHFNSPQAQAEFLKTINNPNTGTSNTQTFQQLKDYYTNTVGVPEDKAEELAIAAIKKSNGYETERYDAQGILKGKTVKKVNQFGGVFSELSKFAKR